MVEDKSGHLKLKITNWQLGYRAGSSIAGMSHEVTATSHVDRLIEDANTAYLPPEALNDAGFIGEHLDIFSLGAIAFYLFSGQSPAVNGLELSQKLRETNGLQLSSVLNGAPESLQDLILGSTRPTVDDRMETVSDFLAMLDEVEKALTEPDHAPVENPNDAQQGDVLAGNFLVRKRLGQGACSVGFLAERDGQEYVLKVANDPDHHERIRDESEVLTQLRHAHIVDFQGLVDVGNRLGILMQPVLVERDKYRIETLGQRIRKEGPLRIDLLQRFGEDLLGVVNFLDEQGISHRDIKPDNIAIGQVGRGKKLHLVLFDFSLARVPRENIKEWETYGRKLGEKADQLAQEDPLVSPERAIQTLQEISLVADTTPLPERRLLQLAAAASQGAALSSRQELYPRGMEAERAFRLSQGALYGVKSLTVQ